MLRQLPALWVVCALCALASGTVAGAAGIDDTAPPAAIVLGTELRCEPQQRDSGRPCAEALLAGIRARIEQDYLRHQGLSATAEELAELKAYHDAFERHDRAQRTRKLAELEMRLAAGVPQEPERARLIAFRDTLVRLARFEADLDAGLVQRDEPSPAALRSLVESAKLDAALHAHYGGSVGVAAFGPYAHGARARLLADYVERGQVIVLDPELKQALHAALANPPRLRHPDAPPDFTPYWRRPIPASYVAP